MRKTVVLLAIGAVAALWALDACGAPDPIYSPYGPETKAQLLKLIPIGSTVKFAKTAIEAKGFVCAMTYNSGYVDSYWENGGGQVSISHPPADFLYCDAYRSTGLFTGMRWQVMLVHENNAIVSVAVGVSTQGL